MSQPMPVRAVHFEAGGGGCLVGFLTLDPVTLYFLYKGACVCLRSDFGIRIYKLHDLVSWYTTILHYITIYNYNTIDYPRIDNKACIVWSALQAATWRDVIWCLTTMAIMAVTLSGYLGDMSRTPRWAEQWLCLLTIAKSAHGKPRWTYDILKQPLSEIPIWKTPLDRKGLSATPFTYRWEVCHAWVVLSSDLVSLQHTLALAPS